MIRRLSLALALAALTWSGAAKESPLFKLYASYQDAIAKSDLAKAKSFLASAKAERLAGMAEQEALSEINVLSPKKRLRAHKEIFDGDDATLIVLANVEGNDSVGRIELVREQGTWKILSELWDLGGDPDDPPGGQVRQPQNDEERAALRQLRARGFPVPTADFLVMSAATGDLEALKLFVKAGYSVDTKDRDSPAIVSAAMGGHDEVVMYLISAGADVNASDGASTALMRIADKCESTPTILALIKAGAKTDGKTAGGATAAQLAEWSGCTENLKAINGKQ